MTSAIDILISVMMITVQCGNCQEWSGCLSSGAVHQVVLKNQALLRFKPPIHSFSDNIYKIHYVLSCLGNPSLVLVEHGYNAAY